MAYDGVVNEDNVYTCVGHPLKTDIRDIVTWMLNEPFSVAYNNIMNVKTLKGKKDIYPIFLISIPPPLE